MENHPIPQDITGFQFKLVGKMTVRQFIYVGTGVFLAWLVYFVLKFPLFLSLPLAAFFSLGGAMLAFLPIDGRPMDVMIGNFIRSVIAPTKYVYEKQGGSAFSPGQTSVSAQISQTPQVIKQQPTAPVAEPAPQPTIPTPDPTPVSQQPEETIVSEEEKVQEQENQLESQIKSAQGQHEDTSQLQEKLNEIIRQKEELEKELADLKIKLGNNPQAAPAQEPVIQTPAPVTPPASPSTQAINTPAPSAPQAPPATTPNPFPANQEQPTLQPTPPLLDNVLPEEPNLVKGSVKDSRGNPLQNILVEVKDEEENPVRAFKTNAKGEFTSATSLPNGKYEVILEDPKMVHKFDTSYIEATGGVLMPLAIVSIDPREELRRELFN